MLLLLLRLTIAEYGDPPDDPADASALATMANIFAPK
jgi:hypothetical protein